jgi:hypothetical protein
LYQVIVGSEHPAAEVEGVSNVIVFADFNINYTGGLFESLLQINWPIQWMRDKLLTSVLSAYIQTNSTISKTISQQITNKT